MGTIGQKRVAQGKSSKMHVLQQLDRAWTSRDTPTDADWNTQAEIAPTH